MNEDRWKTVRDMAKEKFPDAEESTETIGEEHIERLTFMSPQGRMKLEWTVKPKVLGVKTHYSRRAGTSADTVDQVVSKDETVSFLKVYREQDDEWIEIDASAFA